MLNSLINNEIDENEFLNEHNATLIYAKLPRFVNGFVLDYRDINLIIINKNLSIDKMKYTMLHEFVHIDMDHLYKDYDVEREVDSYLREVLV